MNEQLKYSAQDIALRSGGGSEQNQTTEYSKKLLGRVKSAFDASKLIFLGGSLDQKTVNSRHFLPHLPPCPLKVDARPEEVATFNVVFPKVIEALVSTKGEGLSEGNYVREMGGHDYQNLPAIAAEIVSNEASESGVVIRVVNGATAEMPVRALSYMLPAFTLMEQLKKEGIEPPQFQVIFANNISSRLNGLDYGKVSDQSKRFTHVAQDYIKEFFSGLSDSVVFLEDTPLEKDTPLRSGLLKVTRILKDVTSPELIKALHDKGVNGSSRTDVFYGAAHVLMHDIDLPALVALSDKQARMVRPKTIISVGGYQEQFFYDLRHALKPHLGGEYNQTKTLQYFTRHHVPPYYMARDGDISFDEVFSRQNGKYPQIGKAAQYDLDYFARVSSQRGDLEGFFERQRRKNE